MSFIMDYDIVTGGDAEQLAEHVREKINELGWQPYGSAYITKMGSHCQPIVRYPGPRKGEDGRAHFPSPPAPDTSIVTTRK